MNNPFALDVVALEGGLANRLGESVIAIKYLQQCASTNAECMQMAQHGGVVIAEQQTAGRGRRGRSWHSPAVQNIYCSMGIEKRIQARFLGLVSLQVGVCIAEELCAMGFSEVALKWPNDVLMQGRKLGGVLTEMRAKGDDDFFLVIGFGLNTTQDADSLTTVERPAISLGEVARQPIDRQRLLEGLISRIFKAISELGPEHADTLTAQFLQFDSLYGQQVMVHLSDEILPGYYRGLDSTGSIQVETEHGLHNYAAAEISLRGCGDVVDR